MEKSWKSGNRSGCGHFAPPLGIRTSGAGIPACAAVAYKPLMRRPLVLLLALLLVLGGGSFALWSWTVGRMQAGFAAWAAEAAAEGWNVHTTEIYRAGWPFAAELVLSDLSLVAGPDVVPGGADWTAEHAVLHLSPLAPDVLEVRLDGTQRVRAFGSAVAPFTATYLSLSVPLRAAGPVRLSGKQLRFGAPLAGMTIGLLDSQVQQHRDALGFELSAEAIALPPPPAPQPALGDHIASATVAGDLNGTWPPPSPDFAARVAAWQHTGGALRVQHMAMGWGPLGITGTATLRLDASLQPDGAGTVRVVGYEAVLSALTASGTLSPSAAQAIRAVLTLLARTPPDSSVPEVDLPVALHAGVLQVGRIPVGRVPAWDWSAAH